MKTPTALISLALLAALVAWWWAGRSSAPEPASAKPQPAAQVVKPKAKLDSPAAEPSLPAAAVSAATPAQAPLSAKEVTQHCDAILAMDSPAQRLLAFAKLLDATRDQAGLRAIIASFTARFKAGKGNSAEWSAFWSEMVVRDPRLATALIESYSGDEKWHPGTVSMLAYEWAKKDPQAVMAWLTNHQGFSEKTLDGATLNLIAGFAKKDAKAATAYALSVLQQDDPLWKDASWILTNNALQEGGAQGLQAWYDTLPSDNARKQFFQAVTSQLGRESREAQIQWLTAQATSPLRNDKSYRETAAKWAETDPAAALAWTFALPPSPIEKTIVGVGYAVFPWIEKDVPGFARHFQTLPHSQQQEILKVVRLVANDINVSERKRLSGQAFLTSIGQP